MTISVREFLSNFADTAVTLTTTGTVSTDLLVAVHATDYYGVAGMTTPTAGTWTLEVTADRAVNKTHIKIWTRVAGTNGAIGVTFPANSDAYNYAGLYVLSGQDTTDATPAGSSAGASGAASTNYVAPSVDTSANLDDFLISVAAVFGDTTIAPPTGMTERVEMRGTPYSAYSVAELQLAVSGATGTKTFTGASLEWAAASIAIKAAASTSSVNISAVRVSSFITIPTPTVTAVSNVAITASRVSGTTTVPAPIASGSADATPGRVEALATIPEPTVVATSTAAITASRVSGTTTIPEPTTSAGTGATAAPTRTAGSTSVPGPTVDTASNVSIEAVSVLAVTGMPIPNVGSTSNVTIAASRISGISSIPVPTISVESNATVTPTRIETLASIGTSVLSTGTSAAPGRIFAPTSVPELLVSTENIPRPIRINASTSIPGPLITVGAAINPGRITAVMTIPAPTVITRLNVGDGPWITSQSGGQAYALTTSNRTGGRDGSI